MGKWSEEELTCVECLSEGIRWVASNPNGLRGHRQFKHGVLPSSTGQLPLEKHDLLVSESKLTQILNERLGVISEQVDGVAGALDAVADQLAAEQQERQTAVAGVEEQLVAAEAARKDAVTEAEAWRSARQHHRLGFLWDRAADCVACSDDKVDIIAKIKAEAEEASRLVPAPAPDDLPMHAPPAPAPDEPVEVVAEVVEEPVEVVTEGPQAKQPTGKTVTLYVKGDEAMMFNLSGGEERELTEYSSPDGLHEPYEYARDILSGPKFVDLAEVQSIPGLAPAPAPPETEPEEKAEEKAGETEEKEEGIIDRLKAGKDLF